MRIFFHNRQLLLSWVIRWTATASKELVKASAPGKDEVLPQSRTGNRNARRVCEIHGYHV